MKEWIKAIVILPFNVTVVIPGLILYAKYLLFYFRANSSFCRSVFSCLDYAAFS